MEATAKPGPKPLIWVGDSLEMVRSFPEAVRGEIGVALYEAQLGGKHDAAKPLRNIGSGILEVVADHRGDTFCAVYAVRFARRFIYFMRSRKSRRLGLRHRNPKSISSSNGLNGPSKSIGHGSNKITKQDYIESSGNVFADLGFPNADEMLAKAELAIKIAGILRRRHLTQAQAAEILGVDQPKVSALIRGRLAGFSIERLLRFLLLLGTDVSITIKPRQHSRQRSRAKTARRGSRYSQVGVLTVDEIVAVRASKSPRKQQAGTRCPQILQYKVFGNKQFQ
jgi:predicted XRE-type DNA-binding protein/phage-related protein